MVVAEIQVFFMFVGNAGKSVIRYTQVWMPSSLAMESRSDILILYGFGRNLALRVPMVTIAIIVQFFRNYVYLSEIYFKSVTHIVI